VVLKNNNPYKTLRRYFVTKYSAYLLDSEVQRTVNSYGMKSYLKTNQYIQDPIVLLSATSTDWKYLLFSESNHAFNQQKTASIFTAHFEGIKHSDLSVVPEKAQ